ncbi:MAG: hypothetical protein WD572_08945 [Gammaproteobacteria bacterium]
MKTQSSLLHKYLKPLQLVGIASLLLLAQTVPAADVRVIVNSGGYSGHGYADPGYRTRPGFSLGYGSVAGLSQRQHQNQGYYDRGHAKPHHGQHNYHGNYRGYQRSPQGYYGGNRDYRYNQGYGGYERGYRDGYRSSERQYRQPRQQVGPGR